MASKFLQDLDCCLSEPLTITNIRAVLLLLTKAHYSDPANFGILEPELGCLAINPDSEDNDLTIGLDFIPQPKNPSPRPAIWVNFEGVKFNKLAFDNTAGTSLDNSRTDYVKLQQVDFTITHVHESVDIAIMMAETTSDFFLGTRPHLMNKLGLSLMEIESINKPRQSEKSPEASYEVDTRLQIVLNHVMSANIESHRLKKFALELHE